MITEKSSIPLFLLLSLSHASLVRIANVYMGSYLTANLTVPGKVSVTEEGSDWVFEQDHDQISATLQGTKYYLSADISSGTIRLRPAGTGSIPTWTYDKANMALYTQSGSTKHYLSLNSTSTSVVNDTSSNTARVLLYFVPEDNGKPLGDKLKASVVALTLRYSQILDKYNSLLETSSNVSGRYRNNTLQVNDAHHEYLHSNTTSGDDYAALVARHAAVSTTSNDLLAGMRESQKNIVNKQIPMLRNASDVNEGNPARFQHKLQEEETVLLAELDKHIQDINNTLGQYVNLNRYYPEGLYDWLVLCTTLLYLLYIADFCSRVVLPALRRQGNMPIYGSQVTIQLESQSQSETQPEQYLQDDEETFGFSSRNKGQLQLKPIC